MINKIKRFLVPDPLKDVYELTKYGTILDVGCLGFRQTQYAVDSGNTDAVHYGVDYFAPDNIPDGFNFAQVDLNHQKLPFKDDMFDLVVASHVLEHVLNPVEVIGEIVRVTKPNGKIYIEAPSERSLLLPGMPFGFENFHSLSFFDDPTHLSRPWTAQALFRIAKYNNCVVNKCGYITSVPLILASPLIVLVGLLIKSSRLLGIFAFSIGWSAFVLMHKSNENKVYQYLKPKFK